MSKFVGPSSPFKQRNDEKIQDSSEFIGPMVPAGFIEESRLSNDEINQENVGDAIGPALPPDIFTNKKENSDSLVGSSFPVHFSTAKCKNNETGRIGPRSELNSIGPCLPQQLQQRTNEEESKEETFGPALPPGFKKVSVSNQKILGPELPSVFKKEEEYGNVADGDEEFIIGPLPPSKDGKEASQTDIAHDFEKRSQRMKDKLEGRSEPKKLVREEWMTELPPVLQGNFGMGPRQFRARPTEIGDRSGWTDTPQDKARKTVEKEGKRENADNSLRHITERDSRIAEQLDNYNKTQQGIDNQQESLLSMHEKKRKRKLKEDKASGVANIRRPFDREVDLQVNRFDEAAKKRMLKQSAGLSSRFAHGETSGTFL